MNIDEIIEDSKGKWDEEDECFNYTYPDDYVLFEGGSGYSNHFERIIAIFDEDALEVGENIGEAVARWGIEAGTTFDYCLVNEFERYTERFYFL